MNLNSSELKKLYALKLARRGLIPPFTVMTYRNYKASWHHRILAERLMALESGEIDRLMVLMPPRHGKSELASVRFPAWFLGGRHPENRVIATSYSARLAENFGRKVRDLVADPKFSLVFDGVGLSGKSKAADRWETTRGGGYVAAGVGGSITGMGGVICSLWMTLLRIRRMPIPRIIVTRCGTGISRPYIPVSKKKEDRRYPHQMARGRPCRQATLLRFGKMGGCQLPCHRRTE